MSFGYGYPTTGTAKGSPVVRHGWDVVDTVGLTSCLVATFGTVIGVLLFHPKPEPYWTRRCLESHSEVVMVQQGGTVEFGMNVGPYRAVTRTVCDRWSEPVCIIPKSATKTTCTPPTGNDQ